MRGRPYIGGLTRSPVEGRQAPLSPAGGATGPPGGPTGLSPPLFFLSRDFVANLKKKKYI